jgi:hypothetical protein
VPLPEQIKILRQGPPSALAVGTPNR